MATKAIRWSIVSAVMASDLPSPARLIMHTLSAVAVVGTGEIPPQFTPSLSVLAKQTGYSKKTVKTHLAVLSEAGWIIRSYPDAKAMWAGERVRYRLAIPDGLAVGDHAENDDLDDDDDLLDDSEMADGWVRSWPTPGQELPQGGVGATPGVGQELPQGGVGATPLIRSLLDPLLDLLPKTTSLVSADSVPKPKKDPKPQRPELDQLCEYLADKIAENGSLRPTINNAWRTEARLMIDKDGRDINQVRSAIDWCQQHQYWRTKILSMGKLRQKYDEMRLDAERVRNLSNRTVRRNNDLVEHNGTMIRRQTVEQLGILAELAAMDAEREASNGATRATVTAEISSSAHRPGNAKDLGLGSRPALRRVV